MGEGFRQKPNDSEPPSERTALRHAVTNMFLGRPASHAVLSVDEKRAASIALSDETTPEMLQQILQKFSSNIDAMLSEANCTLLLHQFSFLHRLLLIGNPTRINDQHALRMKLMRCPTVIHFLEEYRDAVQAVPPTTLLRFLSTVYGQQYEAWVQMNRLLQMQENPFEVEKSSHSSTPERVRASSIPPKQRDSLFSRISIHGEKIRGHWLTAPFIAGYGLGPAVEMSMDETKIYLAASSFRIPDKRIATLGFVEEETPRGGKNRLVARTYYLSNSHAIWKYLPGYLAGADGTPWWYSKGWDENSITLPFVIQEQIARNSAKHIVDVPEHVSETLFAGTARPATVKGTYVAQIPQQGIPLHGNFYQPLTKREWVKPEDMVFQDSAQEPVFTRPVQEWEQHSNVYGNVTCHVFPSADGSLRYLFQHDERGRAWVAAVEQTGEITSLGLKKNWIRGGALLTPAYSYASEAGGYGNWADQKDGYVDVFQTYLSRVPVIQKYLAYLQKHPKK